MSEAQREMPKYRSHKIVHALKIAKIEAADDGGAIITPAEDGYAPFKVDRAYALKHLPQERGQSGGYYVVYSDGYASWSPVQAFEEGYTRI